MSKHGLKKLIVWGMIWSLMLSVNVCAATDEEVYAGNQLKTLGIYKGYEDGSLRLDQQISRGEVATLIVRTLALENVTLSGADFDFKDVPKSYWGYLNVQNAYKKGIVHGYPDNSFKPGYNITYAEVVAIMVNTLGYGTNITGAWPDNYLNQAKAIGLIPQDSTVSPVKVVTRGEMATIVWSGLLIEKPAVTTTVNP